MSWSTTNLSQDHREQIARGSFTVQEQRGDELHGLCPAHDDKTASFSYNTAKDACFCLACGFKGDLVTLWGRATGHSDNAEAFKAFKERFGNGTLPASSPGKGGQTPEGKGGTGKASEDDEVTKVIPEKEWEQQIGRAHV